MPRAENVIDLRDDNVDGELSLEEQLLDKADALRIDEDEAEDIADELEEELEDELEEKGEEMLERLEELDEEAVKSLIASIEDKDEQREVLAYLSQHKNASRFGDMVRNVLKRKPISDSAELRRLDSKRDRIRFEKAQNRYRKKFYGAAYRGFAQVYKSNWKANEKELKKNFSELLNVLQSQSNNLKSSNPAEAKKLEEFRTKIVVILFSRANVLGREFGYTLSILKNARSLRHSPNRKLFNDRPVLKSAFFAFSDDLLEDYNKHTKSPERYGAEGNLEPLGAEEIKKSLQEEVETVNRILGKLKDLLSARRINSDLNNYVEAPLTEIRKDFVRDVQSIDPTMTPQVPLDIYDTVNRLGFIAREILKLDKDLDELPEKYENLIETIDEIEEQEEEDESTATPETDEEIPSDSSAETFSEPDIDTGVATNSIEIDVLSQVEALLLRGEDVNWDEDVYEQIKDFEIRFKPKNKHFILTLITALIETVEEDLIREDVNLNEVEAKILENKGRSLAEIVEALKSQPDSAPGDSMTDIDTANDIDTEFTLTDDTGGEKDSPIKPELVQKSNSSNTSDNKTPPDSDRPIMFKLTDGTQEDFEEVLSNHREKKEVLDYIRKMFPKDQEVDFVNTFEQLKRQYQRDKKLLKTLKGRKEFFNEEYDVPEKVLEMRNEDGTVSFTYPPLFSGPKNLDSAQKFEQIKDKRILYNPGDEGQRFFLDYLTLILKDYLVSQNITEEQFKRRVPSAGKTTLEDVVQSLKEGTEKKQDSPTPDSTTPSDENNVDLVEKAIEDYLESVEDPILKARYKAYLDLVRSKIKPETHDLRKYIGLISEVDSNPGKYELTLSSLNLFPEELPEKLLGLSVEYGGLPTRNDDALSLIADHFDDPGDTELLYLNKELEEVPKDAADFAYVPIDADTGYVFPADPNAPLKDVIKDSLLKDLFRNWYRSLTKRALGNATTTAKEFMEYKNKDYSKLPKLKFSDLNLKPRSVFPEHTSSFRARKIALAYLYVNR